MDKEWLEEVVKRIQEEHVGDTFTVDSIPEVEERTSLKALVVGNPWLDEKHIYVGSPPAIPTIPNNVVIETDGVIVRNESEHARQIWKAMEEAKKASRGKQKPLKFNKRGKVMR